MINYQSLYDELYLEKIASGAKWCYIESKEELFFQFRQDIVGSSGNNNYNTSSLSEGYGNFFALSTSKGCKLNMDKCEVDLWTIRGSTKPFTSITIRHPMYQFSIRHQESRQWDDPLPVLKGLVNMIPPNRLNNDEEEEEERGRGGFDDNSCYYDPLLEGPPITSISLYEYHVISNLITSLGPLVKGSVDTKYGYTDMLRIDELIADIKVSDNPSFTNPSPNQENGSISCPVKFELFEKQLTIGYFPTEVVHDPLKPLETTKVTYFVLFYEKDPISLFNIDHQTRSIVFMPIYNEKDYKDRVYYLI